MHTRSPRFLLTLLLTWTNIRCLTARNLPPLSPFFSTAGANHRIPQVTEVLDKGVPLDTTFTSSVYCRGAANTVRPLLFMVRRSFCELSKTAFIPLYRAIMQPRLEYAMEANAPTLRADINQLERVQRLVKRLMRGLRYVPYEERHRQLDLFSLKRRRLRPDLRPPGAWIRGTPTDCGKDQAVFDVGTVFFSVRVVQYWNRLPMPLVLFILKKTVGPTTVQNLACSTCVNSVPLRQLFFSILSPQTIYVFLTREHCLCGYCWPSWPFLPFVIKKKLTSAKSVTKASTFPYLNSRLLALNGST